jgi:hypothetical protein
VPGRSWRGFPGPGTLGNGLFFTLGEDLPRIRASAGLSRPLHSEWMSIAVSSSGDDSVESGLPGRKAGRGQEMARTHLRLRGPILDHVVPEGERLAGIDALAQRIPCPLEDPSAAARSRQRSEGDWLERRGLARVPQEQVPVPVCGSNS